MKFQFLIIPIFCLTNIVYGQTTTHRYNSIQEMPKELREEYEEKESFKNLTDSLFLAKDYNQLIDISKEKAHYEKTAQAAECNLIAGYYFLGNQEMSDRLFFETLNRSPNFMNGVSLVINSGTIALLRFMEIPENKKRVMDFAVEEFNKTSVKEPGLGLKLILFYIQDQWIRRNSMNDFKYTNTSRSEFERENQKQQNELFEFYKKTGKLLSEEEIGVNFNNQLILMAHVVDLNQRKFYFTLLQKAVSDNIFTKTSLLNFILRTEYMEKDSAEYWRTLDARIAELRIEYNFPEYYHGIF